jgi:hypothetical protein
VAVCSLQHPSSPTGGICLPVHVNNKQAFTANSSLPSQSDKPAQCSRLRPLARKAACRQMFHPGRLLCPVIVFAASHRQVRSGVFLCSTPSRSVDRENTITGIVAGCTASGYLRTCCYTRRRPRHLSGLQSLAHPQLPRMSPWIDNLITARQSRRRLPCLIHRFITVRGGLSYLLRRYTPSSRLDQSGTNPLPPVVWQGCFTRAGGPSRTKFPDETEGATQTSCIATHKGAPPNPTIQSRP